MIRLILLLTIVAWAQADFDCPVLEGVYANDEDCGSYYICTSGQAILQPCAPTLHFNPKLGVCDYPYRAGCILGEQSTSNMVPPAASSAPPPKSTPEESFTTTKRTTDRPTRPHLAPGIHIVEV